MSKVKNTEKRLKIMRRMYHFERIVRFMHNKLHLLLLKRGYGFKNYRLNKIMHAKILLMHLWNQRRLLSYEPYFMWTKIVLLLLRKTIVFILLAMHFT